MAFFPGIFRPAACFQQPSATRDSGDDADRALCDCEEANRMSTILLIILILLLIGAFPAWPYSRGWGYYPTGGLGLVLIIVIILVLMGRI